MPCHLMYVNECHRELTSYIPPFLHFDSCAVFDVTLATVTGSASVMGSAAAVSGEDKDMTAASVIDTAIR